MPATDERPHPRSGRLYLDQTIHLVVSATQALPVEVLFTYDAADPLAVRMDFTGCADALAPWVFARDLLHAGLHGPSGVGHVRVWPDRRRHGPGSIRILLTGTEGTAVLRVPAVPFEKWLTKTFSVVPAGTEQDYLYWDDVVRELLRQY
ncbi:SsgA family sporulation/cell division regulator [Streptomyces sp. NPDC001093]|uniref:SsgA family sporulation/cell division regulator n=1 Tax=Streptomyces sp. NPDC001093 TaxID=3154376 RepID=UPI0033289774